MARCLCFVDLLSREGLNWSGNAKRGYYVPQHFISSQFRDAFFFLFHRKHIHIEGNAVCVEKRGACVSEADRWPHDVVMRAPPNKRGKSCAPLEASEVRYDFRCYCSMLLG